MNPYNQNSKIQQEEQKQKIKSVQQQPNLNFHETQKGFVSTKIHYHITNWQNYKPNSIEIKQFYQDLERDHSFVQWIFPNFYNSMANKNSYRLTREERNNMIEQEQVMDFYFRNYKMFLKFFGIQWNITKLVLENEQQFNLCLYINTHNQLRLKRIFASLSVLGKRDEALRLLEFIYEYDSKLYFTVYYYYDLVREEKQQILIQTIQTVRGQNDNQGIEQSKDEQNQILTEQGQTQQQQGIQDEMNIEHQIQSPQDFQELKVEQTTQNQDHSCLEEQVQKSQTIDSQIQSSSQNLESQEQKSKDQVTLLVDQNKNLFISNQNKESISKEQAASKNSENQNQLHQKHQRQKNIQYFEQVKIQYVQGDIVNEKWVTIKLLTREKA